jgi:hypothetical protein
MATDNLMSQMWGVTTMIGVVEKPVYFENPKSMHDSR